MLHEFTEQMVAKFILPGASGRKIPKSIRTRKRRKRRMIVTMTLGPNTVLELKALGHANVQEPESNRISDMFSMRFSWLLAADKVWFSLWNSKLSYIEKTHSSFHPTILAWWLKEGREQANEPLRIFRLNTGDGLSSLTHSQPQLSSTKKNLFK